MLLEIVGWLVASAIVMGALCGWWWLPRWQARRLILKDDKERADVEDNFRKTLGQLFGGLAVLIGAGIAYYQLVSQQKQTQLTLQASHEQLISQQISKGFELLGQQDREKVVARLGGIAALEGVMKTSEQYRQPVLEALCAFVRDHTKTATAGPPAIDIQAILTAIGRWEAGTEGLDSSGGHIVDLSGAHIPNARLFEAKLTGANLRHADLSHADLRHAKLFGALLNGADLKESYLSGAKLQNAYLLGTDLRGADLNGADLSGAALTSADLRNTSICATRL